MRLQGKLIFASEIKLLRFCHTLSDSRVCARKTTILGCYSSVSLPTFC